MDKQRFKKVSGFVEKQVGGELVMVPLVGAVASMDRVFSINEMGQFIMELMVKECSKDEILFKLLDEFEVGKEQAIRDLDDFLGQALNAGIVEIC